jgi:hypothetical protein
VLETLKTYNALTDSVVLALMASGLTNAEVEQVSNNTNVTTSQQQKIYAAFNIISGIDLESILVSLNCKTQGLETLADLLNIKKLFPNSYETLTVPVYNAQPGLPTNSKTYYTIFGYAILSPAVAAVVGTTIPPGSVSNSRLNSRGLNPGGLVDGVGGAMSALGAIQDAGTTYDTFKTAPLGRSIGSIATGIGGSL